MLLSLYCKWNPSTERNVYYLKRSSPGWSNHQPNGYKLNLVHLPLKPFTKLNAVSDLRHFKRSSRQLFWKPTMSCPPKSEPARERDPRKTPNVASRWWWWDLNCSFLIHHSEGTLFVQITRSIQLSKKQILKYSTQRYILEAHEEAFNTYWH